MATTINIHGSSNDTNLVLGSNSASIADNGNIAARDISNVVTKIPLVIGSTWPGGFPGLGENAERFINDLKEVSNDTFDISYLSADLNPDGAFSVFPKTQNNTFQAYISADYYWGDYHPAYQFFTTAPFGMTTRENMAWLKFGGGQELWDELSAKFNMKPFAMGTTGNQFGFWSKKELNSVADLSGFRIRIPGAGKDIFNLAGATARSVAGGEIYGELSNNTLDATEWVGPYNDMLMNFGAVTNYHYSYAFHEPGSILAFSMNLDLWNSLPKYLQKIIEVTSERNVMDCFSLFEYNNAVNLPLVYQDVSGRQMPDDIKSALKVAAKTYYEQKVVDLSGQPEVQAFYLRVINSYFTFLNNQQSWTQIQDSYTSSRDISLNLPLTASTAPVSNSTNIILNTSPTVNNVTVTGGNYLWNGVAHDVSKKVVLSVGNYVLNVPSGHPMAFDVSGLSQSGLEAHIEVTSATTIIQPGTMVGTGFSMLPNHKFYSGTVNVTVKQTFPSASVLCGPHGYMGMQNRLIFA